MEPNYNFDQENATNIATTTPQVIRISQTELGALRNQGYGRPAIAEHYGITKEELYQVMVNFGMVKQRTEKENLPSYVIEPVFDLPVLATPVVEDVTA